MSNHHDMTLNSHVTNFVEIFKSFVISRFFPVYKFKVKSNT